VVAAGDIVCEVETSKATSEVVADRSGVLVQTISPPARVAVGGAIGAIAPSAEAAHAYAAARAAVQPASAVATTLAATPRARTAAARHGVSLDAIAQAGVRGTIKERDVERFVGGRSQRPRDGGLPAGLAKYVESAGPMPAFDAAVAAALRQTTERLILTTIDAECRLTAVHDVIRRALTAGRMLSVLHLTIAAVGRALPRHPRLMSVAYDGTIYQYRAVDVAFVARTPDGRLFTPVVRGANLLDVDAVATICQAETMRVMRGEVRVGELEGACFTISHVPVGRTTRVAAIPGSGQSAVLGVSAEHQSIDAVDGELVARPSATLTLAYDHALCDGIYAATFLAEVIADLERPVQ
jgi:pyruvate dehydrogenase E2 component (dihydrolipoamide acetyltransferase)